MKKYFVSFKKNNTIVKSIKIILKYIFEYIIEYFRII